MPPRQAAPFRTPPGTRGPKPGSPQYNDLQAIQRMLMANAQPPYRPGFIPEHARSDPGLGIPIRGSGPPGGDVGEDVFGGGGLWPLTPPWAVQDPNRDFLMRPDSYDQAWNRLPPSFWADWHRRFG